MLSALAQQTLTNKKVERNKYIIVPPPNEIDDWDILEARWHGVPQAVYYDTSNKLAFFPSDIPKYKEKFSFENFGWRRSGWVKFDEDEFVECERIFKELQTYLLEKGIDSYILYMYGSEKGHASVTIDKNSCDNDDISLWVYTKDDNLLDKSNEPKWFEKLI